MKRHSARSVVAILTIAVCIATARAEPTAQTGTRRALIICGLTGDAPHRALFGQTVETIYSALTAHHGFEPNNIEVLWSDPKAPDDGVALAASQGPTTRETLAESAAALIKDLQPEDALWVFVLGHAHFDGKNSWLNLPGPDLNQVEFGELFAAATCREQVFFMTTSASGFFIKPLSKAGRVVITATEADREVNETIFPHKLAAALSEPPAFAEFDIDEDGELSLLDAYLWSARETAQVYATDMLLATEHAQIDDNGDGRGTELQSHFLIEELGGRRTPNRKPPAVTSGDGAIARQIVLRHPTTPPPAEAVPE